MVVLNWGFTLYRHNAGGENCTITCEKLVVEISRVLCKFENVILHAKKNAIEKCV